MEPITETEVQSDSELQSNGEQLAFVPDSMRVQHDNPLNLTQEQLDLKNEEIARLKILYPDVDSYWASIVLDLCLTNSQEKIDEIKARVGPFKRDYATLQQELDKIKDTWKKDMEIRDKELLEEGEEEDEM
jgi:hypothetical protein